MIPFIALGSAALGFVLGRASLKRRAAKTTPASPIEGVTHEPWREFVGLMATCERQHIGRHGKLGAFQMNARRLADVGAMTRAWKGQRAGEEGIWLGEWAPGLTETAFLGSMPLQYAVFVRSMRAAAPKVSKLVGTEVDGKVASLSGLLGVSHAAGERGVTSFVLDARTRSRFPATAQTFERVNGIF